MTKINTTSQSSQPSSKQAITPSNKPANQSQGSGATSTGQQQSSGMEDAPITSIPATAQANLSQTISHALGLAVLNATHAQQQANILHQAVTTLSVEQLTTTGIYTRTSLLDMLKKANQQTD